MSQFSQSPDFEVSTPPSKGMAVSGLVVSIIGCCVPLLGFVGIILGIVAMVRAKSDARRYGGGGIALAAIIVGALSLVVSIIGIILVGLMLPALGQARNAARQVAVMENMRAISLGLMQYADDNRGWFPEAGADLPARLSQYGIAPNQFTSSRAAPGATDALIYVPGIEVSRNTAPSTTIVLYENPSYVPRGTVAVLYVDGHIARISVMDLQRELDASAAPTPPPAPPPSRP